jgi:hypothetical protein
MHSAPRVASYDDALRVLEQAKGLVKVPRSTTRGDNCYPIPGKVKNRSLSVRMTGTGVAFRYYSTDVVTWHPDGSYTYDPFTSRSTCTFFNQFTPFSTYATRDGAVLVIGDTAYPVAGGKRVHVKDGKPSGGLGRFCKTVVNRPAAKRVLAGTRYAEYRAWYAVMKPLLGEQRQPFFMPEDTLHDEANWPMMASCLFGAGHPDKVRTRIYGEHYREVYEQVSFDTVPAAEHARYSVEEA